MAKLKEHMLHDIATTFCGRIRFYIPRKDQNGLSSVEKFVLSGKEPFRVFCRIVMNDVTIEELMSKHLHQRYRGNLWWHESSFLDILMLMWARKLRLGSIQCDDNYSKLYNSKNMAGSIDFEELDVDGSRFDRWPEIFKAFPKLVILKVRAENFASMLDVVPTELVCLKEVELTPFDNKANELLTAHAALSGHQVMLPSLDTIHYVNTPLKDITFPGDADGVLSIKHLKIGAETNCCTPFDYSFLPVAQKMFPSLESVEIRASVYCSCLYDNNRAPKLEVAKSFYEALESLNVGFSIKVTYIDRFSCDTKDIAELREFFATKGKVYGTPEKFAVETSVPGKRLTYEATISVVCFDSNPESDSEPGDEIKFWGEEDSDDYLYYNNYDDEDYEDDSNT
uniref:FBD domain-containing protein n=1 Tax=Panagrellus redivivus TaxID=6233 RepID=A0A7E4ZUE6_PANRE